MVKKGNYQKGCIVKKKKNCQKGLDSYKRKLSGWTVMKGNRQKGWTFLKGNCQKGLQVWRITAIKAVQLQRVNS